MQIQRFARGFLSRKFYRENDGEKLQNINKDYRLKPYKRVEFIKLLNIL